jgi:hypothetical protein
MMGMAGIDFTQEPGQEGRKGIISKTPALLYYKSRPS